MLNIKNADKKKSKRSGNLIWNMGAHCEGVLVRIKGKYGHIDGVRTVLHVKTKPVSTKKKRLNGDR